MLLILKIQENLFRHRIIVQMDGTVVCRERRNDD